MKAIFLAAALAAGLSASVSAGEAYASSHSEAHAAQVMRVRMSNGGAGELRLEHGGAAHWTQTGRDGRPVMQHGRWTEADGRLCLTWEGEPPHCWTGVPAQRPAGRSFTARDHQGVTAEVTVVR